jgi:hypothetical protein
MYFLPDKPSSGGETGMGEAGETINDGTEYTNHKTLVSIGET